MKLIEIPREKTVSKQEFLRKYFKPQKPVVIENFIEDWPAFTKWNLDYMAQIAGDKTVPLYDDRPVSYQDKFNEAHAQMKMSDYIELLKKEPTRYRIFLWNILKEVPELQKDFNYPDFGLRLMKGLLCCFLAAKILILSCTTILIWQISFTFIFMEKKKLFFLTKNKPNTSTKYLTL